MFRFSTLLLHRPNFIKLTTTMAVMAIVAAMVLPIVNDHAKRGHRARARAALLHAALWMERMATAQGRYPVAAARRARKKFVGLSDGGIEGGVECSTPKPWSRQQYQLTRPPL